MAELRKWLAGELGALSVRLERASEWAARTADRVWPPNSGIRAEQLDEFARGDRAPYVYGARWRPNFMAAVEDQLRRWRWPRFAEGGEVQGPRPPSDDSVLVRLDVQPVVLGYMVAERRGDLWTVEHHPGQVVPRPEMAFAAMQLDRGWEADGTRWRHECDPPGPVDEFAVVELRRIDNPTTKPERDR